MSLLLSPRAIGQGWVRLNLDEPATVLTQYLRFDLERDIKYWVSIPPGVVGYPCRFGNLWRKPISWRAKRDAIWAARGNLFKRYILRRTS